MYIVTIDVEKCKACGECVNNCPEGLITLFEEDGKQYAMFSGSPDDCSGCTSCEVSCEEGGVSITEF